MIGKHVGYGQTIGDTAGNEQTIWRTLLKELQWKFGFQPERVTDIAKELIGRAKAR